MSYGQVINTYTVKLSAFQAIGGGIILMSIIYFFNDFQLSPEILKQLASVLIIGLAVGGFFLYFGNKKRTLIIYEDGIEYKESKVKFSANWSDVMLLKSFQEMGKNSSNFIIMKEDEETLTISSAFFKIEYLISAFNSVKSLNKENITIEDDLNWGE